MHTHFSRDAVTTPEQLVARAVRAKLTVCAVSEHNNIDGARAVQRLAPFRVIIAEEVKSSEGEIIGLFLRDPVPKGMSPEDTVRAIKEQGGLVCVPHPFDTMRRSPLRTAALMRILPDVDMLEVYNSRCLRQRDNARAAEFAAEHGLVPSAGSDAHWHPEVGNACVMMPSFEGPGDFLQALRQGVIIGQPAGLVPHFVSTWAKIRFRLGLGGAAR